MLRTLVIMILTAPLLFYVPGWAIARALHASGTDLLERHYERVVISALWSGWLALVLAEVGIFALWLHGAITLSLVVGLWWWNYAPDFNAKTQRRKVFPWELLVFALIGLVGLLLVARPFEVILGVRDAGVYANTGFAIARTGALIQHDPLLAEIGRSMNDSDPMIAGPAQQAFSNFLISQPKDRYIATRLRAAGFFVYEGEAAQGRVVPQGLHLFPAWIGLLMALGGPTLGLFATGLLGMLGAWSMAMLGRRLGGPWVGGLAFLFLVINGVQVWFGRYSTAETTTQFLIWAGLYFFAKAESDDAQPNRLAALMAGIAIGQVALARLDFFLLGPVLAYLLYCWLSRRWGRTQMLISLGLGAMLLHAGLHLAFIARAYLFDTGYDRLREWALIGFLSLPFLTPEVREVYLTAKGSGLASPRRIGMEVGMLLVGLAALFLLRWRSDLLRRLEALLVARRRMFLHGLSVGVLLLAAYAYLLRPAILDSDLLFNTRGGWNDPLSRDPALVAADVRAGWMGLDEARTVAGVVMQSGPYWFAQPDLAATALQRERLAQERGPWQGPFSAQSLNWLRLQGYVGAPIRLPVSLWYNEYAEMNWWQRLTVDPATLTSTPAPINDKYMIPLANLVRVGWYLSPLGLILGVVGYALWWRRGLTRASWLFLTVAFIGTFFYVRQTYGTSDQHYIYILRRFVPIAYPAFCLGMGYALVLLARQFGWMGRGLAWGLAGVQILFLLVTNQPIYRHTEYAGAVEQVAAVAQRFTPGQDVLLLRGGAPIYAQARDVPDMLATPLRYAFGLDAFTVKSSRPGSYAEALAAQVEVWRSAGHSVYLVLSASGANFALPGYRLEPVGGFELDLPEFEQLTNQKPRNVAQLRLPFQIYRLEPGETGTLASQDLPISAQDFAAQVSGFHLPEVRADGSQYAWTNGDAILRLAWPLGATRQTVWVNLAAGKRPAHLGPATVCFSAQAEDGVWPEVSSSVVELGCTPVGSVPNDYALELDPARVVPTQHGTMLLRISNQAWVPAAEDPQQSDQRGVGVQFGGLRR
ncbi:hypothetical protein OSCT_1591 [Oscillochloris trichoides DG-6]|uniref:Glycosyltransferase RgtA/B/C/D-like domain-containing protein n=1 Tax=Oscillochloris trichoides DG-6 TaxID=765420 RepID=E1IE40_9CHLR|nr:hypothetical protein [Oscillochloris trichoides]EFO80554.1 hypothetical protein OSCT_1591 [Oscillochloris trichoides DG-6]